MSGEQLALAFIGLLLGLFEAGRLIDVIKNYLGWEGPQAKLLAAGVSVVVSLAALFVSGEVGIADFTLENFPVVFGLVYPVAELVYYFKK